MRTPVIAGNWKLFKTIGEATATVRELVPLVAGNSSVDIIVSPVFTSISRVAEIVTGTSVKIAAQDCFWEEEGAFTGEVGPRLLQDAGCSYVIIGHSERRQYFGETDVTVNRKCRAAIAAGLKAIVCVGEQLADREADRTFAVIEQQVTGGLDGFTPELLDSVIIAYEPVWAIGTGKTASDAQAQEVHRFIRGLVTTLFGLECGDAVRILYGGSVKPDNISGLMKQPDIDGALVGGASLKADSFAAIVNFTS